MRDESYVRLPSRGTGAPRRAKRRSSRSDSPPSTDSGVLTAPRIRPTADGTTTNSSALISSEQLEGRARQAAREREQARAKALSFPKRHDIYAILCAREACPKEVAEELEMKLHTVMYHFRCLAGKERGYTVAFIREVGTDVRLGGVQHLWKAIDMPLVDMHAAEAQPRAEREETSDLILRRMRDDMAGAVEAGTVDAHAQRSLLRMHTTFDEEGMHDAAVLAENYLEALKEIAGESANRIARGTHGFAVATETMIFPVPGVYWRGI